MEYILTDKSTVEPLEHCFIYGPAKIITRYDKYLLAIIGIAMVLQYIRKCQFLLSVI